MDYSAFIKNRLPALVLNRKSPIEIVIPKWNILKKRSRFRPFEQPVFIHTYSLVAKKLIPLYEFLYEFLLGRV